MRWQRLFDDLEAQLDAAEQAAFDGEVADRTRREVALVHIADRLAAATGTRLRCSVQGAGIVTGSVVRAGADWLLLADEAGRDLLVALGALVDVAGLRADVGPTNVVGSKLGLGHVLRGIARDRTPVVLQLVIGDRIDGTIDRVGADFVDVAVHPLDAPRRSGEVIGHRAVTMAGIAIVRSA